MRFNLVAEICKREVRERTRSKFFRIGLFLTIVIVVVGVVAPSLSNKPSKTPTYYVGLVQPAPPELQKAIQASGPSLGADIEVLPYQSVDSARKAVDDGNVAAAVVPNQQVIVQVSLTEGIVSTESRVASTLATIGGQYAALGQVGLTPEQSTKALSTPSLAVNGLHSAAHRSAKNATAAGASIVILFVFLNLYAAFILNGVIEEKTSRVVEILLSTVRAEELLLGKVLGIGIVGSIQGIVLVVATFIARANSSNLNNGSLSMSVILYTVLWFFIGFGMYAWMYACAGALVSRSEDSQSLVLVLQLPLLSSYLVATISSINGPSQVATVMSMFPFTAPMTMLERMSAQEAPLWQVLLSIGLCLVTIVAVMRLAVVIFRGGVLKSGGRVKIKDALRAN